MANKQDHLHMSEEELASLIRPQNDRVSQVANFYENRSVLITGASGFVGKVLVEKLVRACVNIKRIYVLIRPKRNKKPEERLEELVGSILFDGVRRLNLIERVVAIEGDITKPLLGLREQDLAELVDNVSVCFHSAAIVGFEQPLKRAIEANLTGTHNVIQLCRRLPKLVSLVYVSTAYSNCIRQELDEHIYPVNVDPQALVEMASSLDQEFLELIKDSLVGRHPNTYTYTKSLSEWLCGQYVDKLPIVICRPSVVVCTWREPLVGYLDNVNAGNGIYTYIGQGLLRSAHGEARYCLDHIPVDTVANCIIVLGWFAYLFHRRQPCAGTAPETDDATEMKLDSFRNNIRSRVLSKGMPEMVANLPVFHATSGAENSIPMGQVANYIVKYSTKYPSLELFRYPNFAFTSSKCLNSCYSLVSHIVPAHVVDSLVGFVGGSSNWVRVCKRANSLTTVVAYFLLREWKFSPDNRLTLINEFMSDEDRRLFNCDIKQIDWEAFCHNYALGIRKFMIKEPMSNLNKARARLRMVYWRNTALQLMAILAVCYVAVHFV